MAEDLEQNIVDRSSQEFLQKARGNNSLLYRLVLPLPILASLLACGGNSSPTSPTPPDNGGGNLPPTQNNYSAAGKFLDPTSNAGYNGTLMFGNTPGTVSGGDWAVQNINPGQGALVVFPENGGNLERRTRVNSTAGQNSYEEMYGFPNDRNLLERFNQIGRRNSGLHGEGAGITDGTIKWAEFDENGSPLPPPTIHVDDQTLMPILTKYSTGDGVPYTKVLENTLSIYIGQAYEYLQGAQVIRHPTSATLPADGTPRAIIMKVIPKPIGITAGGLLRVYADRKNNLTSCTIDFIDGFSHSVIVAEACQCASGLTHSYTSQTPDSVYNAPVWADKPTAIDIALGKLQRKMRAGTRSPWDDSHLSAINPASVASVAASLDKPGFGLVPPGGRYTPPPVPGRSGAAQDPRKLDPNYGRGIIRRER